MYILGKGKKVVYKRGVGPEQKDWKVERRRDSIGASGYLQCFTPLFYVAETV